MRHKGIFRSLSALLLLVAGVIYYNSYFTDFGTFVFSFSLSISLVILFLSFSGQEIVNTWMKFALVWFSLSIIIFLLAPKYRTGGFLPIGPDKELIAQFMAGVFFVISLFIIAWKSFKSRKKGI